MKDKFRNSSSINLILDTNKSFCNKKLAPLKLTTKIKDGIKYNTLLGSKSQINLIPKRPNRNQKKYDNDKTIKIRSIHLNFDEKSEVIYNPNPFEIKRKSNLKNFYIDKIEQCVMNYNKIKLLINKNIIDNQISELYPNDLESQILYIFK